MQQAISIPPFEVDLANELILRHGREIRLRRKTFALLRYLLSHRDRLLTKDELLDKVWHDAHVGDAVLKVTISQIRRTFRECPSLEIATTHGRGYRVRLDETAGKAASSNGDAPGQHIRALTGRARELEALQTAFEKARHGQRQIVFVAGDAGIGKSALVDAFVARIDEGTASAGRTWLGRCNCQNAAPPMSWGEAAVRVRHARAVLPPDQSGLRKSPDSRSVHRPPKVKDGRRRVNRLLHARRTATFPRDRRSVRGRMEFVPAFRYSSGSPGHFSMNASEHRSVRSAETMDARTYSPPWRIVSVILVLLSRGSVLFLLVLLLFFETRLGNPLRLIRTFVAFCLVPEIAAWLVARAFQTKLRIDDSATGPVLVLEQRRHRIEIPFDSLDGVVPWSLPLPGGGVWLRLKSGRRYRYGLQVANPVTLAEAITDAAEGAPERVASSHPNAVYAQARSCAAHRWDHPVFKFGLFALVPAMPLFRLHQWITYGGTFGEYYQYGLQAYVLAFTIYWAQAAIWLLLYAAGLRVLTETTNLIAVRMFPSHATGIRLKSEFAHRIFYYGGVAFFLLRLFVLTRPV